MSLIYIRHVLSLEINRARIYSIQKRSKVECIPQNLLLGIVRVFGDKTDFFYCTKVLYSSALFCGYTKISRKCNRPRLNFRIFQHLTMAEYFEFNICWTVIRNVDNQREGKSKRAKTFRRRKSFALDFSSPKSVFLAYLTSFGSAICPDKCLFAVSLLVSIPTSEDQ